MEENFSMEWNRVAIRPVLAGTVPFLGLGPGVRPVCHFVPKFLIQNLLVLIQYVNDTQTSHLLFCITCKAQIPSFMASQTECLLYTDRLALLYAVAGWLKQRRFKENVQSC